MESGLVDNLQKYQWSTHKIYLSNAKKWEWLHKDYILKLFSESKPESIKLYKQFVVKETHEEINRIFGRKNLPTVLGNESFINSIKNRFFNLKDFEEIPESKRLAPEIWDIKNEVCRAYEIMEKELYLTRRGYFNEPRNVAVYLIRGLRNDTLKKTGEQFGIEKYSTVSSIVEKVKREMKTDKNFAKRIQNISDKFIKGQK